MISLNFQIISFVLRVSDMLLFPEAINVGQENGEWIQEKEWQKRIKTI